MNITQRQAVELCRYFEKKLAPDYHVALTGSCLYGGNFAQDDPCDSYKDADILIYPKNDDEKRSMKVALKKLGIPYTARPDEKYDRLVHKAIVNGFNVDFLFAGWR